MNRAKGFAILFIILVLPLILYFLARAGTHRKMVLPILSEKIANPDGSPDSVYKPVADFSFLSQNGDEITQADFDGLIWVANVFYTSCGAECQKVSTAMTKIQTTFAEDPGVKLLSVTVDPVRDSVAALQVYADRYEADFDKWLLVTGAQEKLQAFIRDELGMIGKQDSSMEHGFAADNTLRLIDKEGLLRGRTYDMLTRYEVDTLITHIDLLKYEYATKK